MGPWSDAPRDILQVIAEKINHHSDFIHFGALCKTWRSVYMDNRHHLPQKLPIRLCHPRQLAVPLLLRSCKEETGTDTHEFICLSDEKVYDRFFLPEAINKWICGSSWGWLVTVDIAGEEIHLLNPITRSQIQLPPLSSFTKHEKKWLDGPIGCYYIRKAIISADPSTHSSDSVVVLAITGNSRALSYCRLGDTKWTNIENSPVFLEDIIYHEGRFYAIDRFGVVVAFDSVSPEAVGMIIVGDTFQTMEEDGEVMMMKYLAMSSGVLLKVAKMVDQNTSKTIKFNVYMLQKSELPIHRIVVYGTPGAVVQGRDRIFYKWVKLESLGDQMLLLGINSSMSLPAHLFPNFKSSCIYFTEKHYRNLRFRPVKVKHDMGIFDMNDGSIHSYCLHGPTLSMPLVWVTPNIW